MQILVLGLCLAVAFIHGASSQLVPESVVTTLIEQDNSTQKYKRQTTAQLQCVSNRLDVIFRGNNASFVSQCKSVAVAQVQLDASNPSRAQAQISPFYRAYCNRECGDAINDAYNECGVYSSAPAGTEALNIDLCGTNEDGNICYQLYGDGLTIVRTEASCYNTYISTDVCTCRSALSEAGDRQGCCLDAYHDFVSGLGPSVYNPSVLYNACNVGRQSSCTNNPYFVPVAPPTTNPTNPTTDSRTTGSTVTVSTTNPTTTGPTNPTNPTTDSRSTVTVSTTNPTTTGPTTADDSDSDSSNSSPNSDSGATSFTSTVTAIIASSFLYAMF